MRKLRLRKQALGDRNLIGSRVEAARKKQGMKQKELLAQLQVSGVDMNASGLSRLNFLSFVGKASVNSPFKKMIALRNKKVSAGKSADTFLVMTRPISRVLS